jgi:hypothetical protein
MENEEHCQSCGMPLYGEYKKFSQKDTNGTDSIYCTMCYQDGRFLNPDIKIEEMVEIGVGFMKAVMNEEEARKQLQGFLPQLKRWA